MNTTKNNAAGTLQPYLFFNGRCEEAIDFYSKAIGAEVKMLMRFKDCPPSADSSGCPGATPDKIMHANLSILGSTVLVSDGQCQGKPNFQGFSLSLTAQNEKEAERLFNALSDGGQIEMPLAKTFFSPRFGMLTDRFGVGWMVYVAPQDQK